MKIELGKINSVTFGYGGYQGALFGIWFTLGGSGWGVCDGKGNWQGSPSEYSKWTLEDKKESQGEIMLWIEELMTKAKVKDINKLVGIPVEMTFDSPFGKLVSWRILTEVL